ncbi:hypothetical protein DFH09DRAFT_1067681 [Mycena vulgaris]|nr:hypothetical protein DFH09DRAFT_1067681 [Mycena vulgaris]
MFSVYLDRPSSARGRNSGSYCCPTLSRLYPFGLPNRRFLQLPLAFPFLRGLEALIRRAPILRIHSVYPRINYAALYFYDFLLTFPNEVEVYRHSDRNQKLLWSFISLRYLPALYQPLMVSSLIYNSPTLRRCDLTGMGVPLEKSGGSGQTLTPQFPWGLH